MGGLVNSQLVKGDLWMIELATGQMACYPVNPSSEGPCPRVGHSSLLVGNAFIVFGGDTKTEEGDVLDDTLYLLNTGKSSPLARDNDMMLIIRSNKSLVESLAGRTKTSWSLRPYFEHPGFQDLYFRWPS